MERKLVKQGRNALTVTLPAKWLKSKSLKAGDILDLEQSDEGIQISIEPSSTKTSTSINICGMERSMVWHKILAAYLHGYDQIHVRHDNPKLLLQIVPSLIGMVLEYSDNDKALVKSIILTPEKDIMPLIRRTGHMVVQSASMLEDAANGKVSAKDVKLTERLLDSNINYCLRYINKYKTTKKDYQHLLLLSTMEKIGDIISEISNVNKNIETARKVHKIIQNYNKLIFTQDAVKLYRLLRKFRKESEGDTFADGLVFMLAELLYDNLGYLTNWEKE